MLKQFSFLILFVCCSADSFSQRVLSNFLPNDIDVRCNDVNADMAKNKSLVKLTYRGLNCLKDSSRLIEEANYDSKGRITKLRIGHDIRTGNIDCESSYKQLSDSTFESIARYRIGSKVIPGEFFMDTLVNGKRQKLLLFKHGRDSTFTVRSVYLLDNDSEIATVHRFDSDNKLVLIFYPWGGNRIPLKTSKTLVKNAFDSVVTLYSLYKENEYEAEIVYNRYGKVRQITRINRGFQYNDTTVDKQFTIFDDKRRPVIKLSVDESNRFVSESRFYYNDSSLIRYTQDSDLTDTLFDELRIFNVNRKLIFSQTFNKYRPAVFKWYYEYDKRNLLVQQKSYDNDTLLYCERYEYR